LSPNIHLPFFLSSFITNLGGVLFSDQRREQRRAISIHPSAADDSGELIPRCSSSVGFLSPSFSFCRPTPETDIQNCKQDKSFHTYLGCLGALDGMMVAVRPTLATQAKYRNRKGQTAINVLGVVNQQMQFVYCLYGWPGSAHDSRILRDAMARDNSF
ncbi:hypothetical protein LINPERHAP2_LOCUS210, partial [Linum perenne]